MSRTYEFAQVDVFTQTALTGNALAVFSDARGLTTCEPPRQLTALSHSLIHHKRLMMREVRGASRTAPGLALMTLTCLQSSPARTCHRGFESGREYGSRCG